MFEFSKGVILFSIIGLSGIPPCTNFLSFVLLIFVVSSTSKSSVFERFLESKRFSFDCSLIAYAVG